MYEPYLIYDPKYKGIAKAIYNSNKENVASYTYSNKCSRGREGELYICIAFWEKTLVKQSSLGCLNLMKTYSEFLE